MNGSTWSGAAAWLLLIALLAVSACSDGDLGVEPDPSPEGTAELSIYVPFAALPVGRLAVEVSAADLDTLHFNLPLEDSAASGTVTIRAGSDRTITLRAFNHSGVETHTGSTTLDIVEGENPAVSITLDALGEGDPMQGIVGEYELLAIEVPWPFDPYWNGYLGNRQGSVQLVVHVIDGAGDTIDVPVHWAGPGVTSRGLATTPPWDAGAATMVVTATAVAGTRARQTNIVFQDWAPIGVATQVEATMDRSCAINDDGRLFCWGSQVLAPSPIAPGMQFTDVAVGSNHACAVAVDGSAWCWGLGTSGELGDGAATSSDAPVQVAGGHTFTDVSVGNAQAHHSCGLTDAGEVWCWGDNQLGQLGDGTLTSSPVPVKAASDLEFRSLVTGFAHNCAVTVDDDAYCWGNNHNGKVGSGTTENEPTPVAVAGGHKFAAVSAGTQVTCGLTTASALYCWGNNTAWNEWSVVPAEVSTTETFVDLDVGHGYGSFHHMCATTAAGTAFCWGYNAAGQVGDGTTTEHATPVAVSGGLTFADIAAGGDHSCAIASDGVAYCWGDNAAGELGTLSRDSTLTPETVASPTPESVPVP